MLLIVNTIPLTDIAKSQRLAAALFESFPKTRQK